MAHLTDYKLGRILRRFPWRRRKPRASSGAPPPIGIPGNAGRTVWAQLDELAKFEDPGPALVCATTLNDEVGRPLLRELVVHHASSRGVALPDVGPERTRVGLELLRRLADQAGLDPGEPMAGQTFDDLLSVTWAITVATDASLR